MNCAEISEQTIDFLYGELDEPGRRAFEGHVATCDSCRREIEGLGGALTQTRAHLRATAEAPPAKVKLEAERLATAVARRKGQPLRTVGAPAVAEDAGGIWSLLRRPWFFPAFAAASVIGIFFLAREVIVPAGGRQAIPVAEPAEPVAVPASPPAAPAEQPPSLGLPALSPPVAVAPEGEAEAKAESPSETRTGTKGGPAKRPARPRVEYRKPVLETRSDRDRLAAMDERMIERAELTAAKRRSENQLAKESAAAAEQDEAAMPVRATAGGAATVAAGPQARLRLDDRQLAVAPPLGAAAGISPRPSRAANAPAAPAMPPPAAPAMPPPAAPAAPAAESYAGAVDERAPAAPTLATLVERADRLFADGRMEEAAAAYQSLIERYPTHASLRTWKDRLTEARAVVARERAARRTRPPAAPASAAPAQSR